MYREWKLRDDVSKLEPGDIIRMNSRAALFLHYGIAVGDGFMIHLVPEPEQNRFIGKGLYEKVDIVTYCLETDKSCEKDNSRDTRERWDPYPASEVVKRAYSKLRDSFEFYSVIFNNCEKFALWCRYKNQVGLGDQSSTALVLGTAATYAFGAVFGPALTLGAGALAIGAWLRSSTNPGESGNQRIAASSASMRNIPANTGQVAKTSALGALATSGYRMTKGENPLRTFPVEFGSKFVNGMATEVAYDVGSSLMASKDVFNSDSDDSNAGGRNEFLTKSVLGASIASTSRAFLNGENPVETLGEEFAENLDLGAAAKEVIKLTDSSLPASAKSKRKRNKKCKKTAAKELNF